MAGASFTTMGAVIVVEKTAKSGTAVIELRRAAIRAPVTGSTVKTSQKDNQQ